MTLPFALCKVTPTYFHKNGTDVQIALGLVRDIQELTYIIAHYNFVRAGDRIIGAFEFFKEEQKAAEIREALKKIGFSLKGTTPFAFPSPAKSIPFLSPCHGRILTLWATLRSVVIQHFPKPPGIPDDPEKYLHHLEDLYAKDAYNSLAIEGYQVSPALIEQVLNHRWNPDLYAEDAEQRNALAARGYYEAFSEVKKAIAQVLDGASPGHMIRKELPTWFQKLFSPSVQAGILKPTELLGYRKAQVYIRNSRHVPFPKEALPDAMGAFFDCLEKEPHPAVRAILGHFIFVYIHPFMDGNGRLGRFIMNAMLASGGYHWTTIQMEDRSHYFAALEAASVTNEIAPFTIFVKNSLSRR